MNRFTSTWSSRGTPSRGSDRGRGGGRSQERGRGTSRESGYRWSRQPGNWRSHPSSTSNSDESGKRPRHEHSSSNCQETPRQPHWTPREDNSTYRSESGLRPNLNSKRPRYNDRREQDSRDNTCKTQCERSRGSSARFSSDKFQKPSNIPSKIDDVMTVQAGKSKQGMAAETDPHRIQQRQRQIDFGKNTVGYDRYSKLVPKHKRTSRDPQTPDPTRKYSKRMWDSMVRTWRKRLHQWDAPEESATYDLFSELETERRCRMEGKPIDYSAAAAALEKITKGKAGMNSSQRDNIGRIQFISSHSLELLHTPFGLTDLERKQTRVDNDVSL